MGQQPRGTFGHVHAGALWLSGPALTDRLRGLRRGDAWLRVNDDDGEVDFYETD